MSRAMFSVALTGKTSARYFKCASPI